MTIATTGGPNSRQDWDDAKTMEYSLNITQSAVLHRVALRAGPPNGVCFETRGEMARGLGADKETVNRALRFVAKKGLLEPEYHHRKTTRYRLKDLEFILDFSRDGKYPQDNSDRCWQPAKVGQCETREISGRTEV